jgi:hypothetical protein
MENIKNYWIYIMIAFGICMFVKPVLCFLIGGALVFYFGISALLFLEKLRKHGIECTGRISSIQHNRSGSKEPVVEFTATGGELVAKTPYLSASTDLAQFRTYKSLIGTEVPILYDPGKPERFVVKEDRPFTYFALLFAALIGLAFIAFATASLLGYIKINFPHSA